MLTGFAVAPRGGIRETSVDVVTNSRARVFLTLTAGFRRAAPVLPFKEWRPALGDRRVSSRHAGGRIRINCVVKIPAADRKKITHLGRSMKERKKEKSDAVGENGGFPSRCIHGTVPLHPSVARGVLRCGGCGGLYITSRRLEKRDTPRAHAQTNLTKKKRIQ